MGAFDHDQPWPEPSLGAPLETVAVLSKHWNADPWKDPVLPATPPYWGHKTGGDTPSTCVPSCWTANSAAPVVSSPQDDQSLYAPRYPGGHFMPAEAVSRDGSEAIVLAARVAHLERRVAELEARLNRSTKP